MMLYSEIEEKAVCREGMQKCVGIEEEESGSVCCVFVQSTVDEGV